MIRRWRREYGLWLLFTIILGACSGATVERTTQVITVSGATKPCVGVDLQRCYLITDSAGREYLFYDEIEGYTHQEGVTKTLLVAITSLASPAADQGRYRYQLIREVP